MISSSTSGMTVAKKAQAEVTWHEPNRLVDLTIPWVVENPLSSFQDCDPLYADVTHRALTNIFAPATVLIDSSGMIRYCCGPTDLYLRDLPRRTNVKLTGVVREGLTGMVQRLVHQITRHDAEKITAIARVKREGVMVEVGLSLFVIKKLKREESLFLVCFADRWPTLQPNFYDIHGGNHV
jgi:hypothetical protein